MAELGATLCECLTVLILAPSVSLGAGRVYSHGRDSFIQPCYPSRPPSIADIDTAAQ
jgi:hypothetical protein